MFKIETKRLLIKAPTLLDVENWYALHADPEVMQFLGGARDKETNLNWLEQDILHCKKHGFCLGSVFEKTSGEFIGRAGLVYLNYNDSQSDIEIGYELHKIYWNKGYGIELVTKLIDWGFSHLNVTKLVSVTRPENKRSQRVLEKCNMRYIKRVQLNNIYFDFYEIDKEGKKS